jgi:hypothetical protein
MTDRSEQILQATAFKLAFAQMQRNFDAITQKPELNIHMDTLFVTNHPKLITNIKQYLNFLGVKEIDTSLPSMVNLQDVEELAILKDQHDFGDSGKVAFRNLTTGKLFMEEKLMPKGFFLPKFDKSSPAAEVFKKQMHDPINLCGEFGKTDTDFRIWWDGFNERVNRLDETVCDYTTKNKILETAIMGGEAKRFIARGMKTSNSMNNYHNLVEALFETYAGKADTAFTITKIVEALKPENYSKKGIQNYLGDMKRYFQKMKSFDNSGTTWPNSFNAALLANLPEELRTTYHNESIRLFPGDHPDKIVMKLEHGFRVLSKIICEHMDDYQYRLPDFGKSEEVAELRSLMKEMKDNKEYFLKENLTHRQKLQRGQIQDRKKQFNRERSRPAPKAITKPVPVPEQKPVQAFQLTDVENSDNAEDDESEECEDTSWVLKVIVSNPNLDPTEEEKLFAIYDKSHYDPSSTIYVIDLLIQCAFCPGDKSHNTNSCKQSMQYRHDKVAELGLCRRCLQNDHTFENCPEVTISLCETCKRFRHHKMLCFVGKPQSERPKQAANRQEKKAAGTATSTEMKSAFNKAVRGNSRGGPRGRGNSTRGRGGQKANNPKTTVMTASGILDTHRESYEPHSSGTDTVEPPAEAEEYEDNDNSDAR